jgi:hypothetical protein
MKNFYYFNDDINIETVNNLVEKLQGYEGKIELYFSTYGGEIPSMRFLIKFLNSLGDRITVTLTDIVMSAGTLLLLDYTGKLKIDYENVNCILFHFIDREGYSLRSGGTVSEKVLVSQVVEMNKVLAEKIKNKGLLTDKQLKQFNKGRDVVAYQEQIATWNLAHSEKKKKRVVSFRKEMSPSTL